MQVSVEATGAITRRMTVTVPAEDVEQAVVSRLKRLSGQVKMPGFRPGKVPMKMVEAQYGGRVLQEVGGELIQTSFRQALGQEQLRPAGGPHIEPKSLERGKALEYTAEFDVYPEIAHTDLSGRTVRRPVCEIAETDVDKTIETLRKQRPVWTPVERAAQNEDRVKLDFTGRIDGAEFPGGKAQDYELVLGAGNMIPGFEDGLIGLKAGETSTIDVTFPDDYPATDLAGKPAQFDVAIKDVAEPKLPDVDEAFMRELGSGEGGPEGFRNEVRSSLEREAATRIRTLLRNRVFDALLSSNPIDLPRDMVADEIRRLRETEQRARQAQGLAPHETLTDEVFRASAERRVALGLIMAEVLQQRGIKPDPQRVKERLREMAASYEQPEAFIRWYEEKRERMAEIESLVLEEHVVDAMLETANVEDEATTFEELVELGKTGGNA